MKTIYKYHLDVVDEQFIEMPKGAKLLSVGVQFGEPFLWAEVDTSRNSGSAQIRIFGTGQPGLDVGGLKFIGTFQLDDGTFVGHVYGTTL